MNTNAFFTVSAEVFQQTGSRNQEAGKACEDGYHIFESEDLLFYGLADGQSGTLHGAEGGRAALGVVEAYIQHRGIDNILSTPFPDELPCLLMQQIRNRLLSLAARKGCGFREFASTLLAIAIDPVTGRYILLHLGDGCAICVQRDGNAIIRSGPDNSFTPQYTWLTTGDTAVAHMRVSFGSLEHVRRLLLMTDGAGCLCQGKNIPRQAKNLISSGSAGEFQQTLRQSRPRDDASCIILEFSQNVPCELT